MPRRPSLSCRQFRRLHAEYVDGFLCHDDTVACTEHVNVCEACATHDVKVRRSLLALQALPMIEPSPEFRARLAARLANEAAAPRSRSVRGARWGLAGVILAASIAGLLFVSATPKPTTPTRLAPVLARAPEPLATPAVPATPKAVASTRPTPRFEALQGQLPLRTTPDARPAGVRVQTVTYIGQ